MFPTAVALCNGTSVGTLTAYSPRCAKHNSGIDWRELSLGLRFITQHFLFSYAIKSPPQRPPHWLSVILGYTYRSAETSIFLYMFGCQQLSLLLLLLPNTCHHCSSGCQALVTTNSPRCILERNNMQKCARSPG